MIVGTLHECTLGKDVTHLQVGAYGSVQVASLEFNPQKGFFLNGKPVKFKGVCMHQDHAGVGVTLPDAIHSFRITRLKMCIRDRYKREKGENVTGNLP